MNKKKFVVITGATRGIGLELVKLYAKLGCDVVGVYKVSTSIATKIEMKYSNVRMIKADLGNSVEVTRLVTLIKKFSSVVDLLINNAGIYVGGGVKTLTPTDLQYAISVNVLSKYILTQSLLPLLEKSSQPKVVNIASRFGFVGNADPDSLSYNITNSAIVMMSLAMQKEFQENSVSVGCYIPTVTNTDRFKSAFTTSERLEIKKSGMLASKKSTASKIYNYVNSLSGKGVTKLSSFDDCLVLAL